MVISFPCKVSEDTPIESSYTFREQLDFVRRMQAEWSDNSVSCTVYYKREDIEDIKNYLNEHYKTGLKTVSFLLSSGHGFDQAPFETISKEQYLEMVSKVTPITSIEIKEGDFELDACSSGHCPIK